jgi:hypothetical protein
LSLFGGREQPVVRRGQCRAQAATALFAMGHPHPGTTRRISPHTEQRCCSTCRCLRSEGVPQSVRYCWRTPINDISIT